jgi:6,7-dimethyl-8-ribityllumazine synthase
VSASEFWPGEQPKAVPATGGVDAGEVDEGAVEDVVGAAASEPSEDTEDFDEPNVEEPGFDDPEEADEDDDGDDADPDADEPDDEPAEEPAEEAEPLLRLAGHAPGDLTVPDDIAVLEGAPLGGRRGVGIVAARFNGDVTNRLLESALAELERAGVPNELVTVMAVPGAFELPLGAMALAKTRRYSAIVALGCVIRGETAHFDYVAGETASGLQLAALETGVPVSFGVLTVDTLEQAMARVGKGAEAVRTALEMADLFGHLRAQAKQA